MRVCVCVCVCVSEQGQLLLTGLPEAEYFDEYNLVHSSFKNILSQIHQTLTHVS